MEEIRHIMQKSPTAYAVGLFWQGHKDLNF